MISIQQDGVVVTVSGITPKHERDVAELIHGYDIDNIKSLESDVMAYENSNECAYEQLGYAEDLINGIQRIINGIGKKPQKAILDDAIKKIRIKIDTSMFEN